MLDDMAGGEFLAISFDDGSEARRLVEAIDHLDQAGDLRLIDLITLRCDASGEVRVDETLLPSVAKVAAGGGVGGLVVGALLGIPILGLAAGAAAAGLAAKTTNLGIPDDVVEELRQSVTPGRVVVAALSRVSDGPAVLDAFSQVTGGRVVAGNITSEGLSAVSEAIKGFEWDQGINPMAPEPPQRFGRD